MNRFFIFTTILLALVAVPAVAHGVDASLPYWGGEGLVSCSGAGQGDKPPCTSVCDILETFQLWVHFAITIGVFVIVPLMIVIGGVLMMIGGGNDNLLKMGKSTLTNAIWGLVIILGAFIIINTFIWLITGVAGGEAEDNKWYNVECSVGDGTSGGGGGGGF